MAETLRQSGNCAVTNKSAVSRLQNRSPAHAAVSQPKSASITHDEKHLKQPYYFTRWFYCRNPHWHMAERFKVWSNREKAKEATEAAKHGQIVWGDAWDHLDTSSQ